jgi:hypothetical protein
MANMGNRYARNPVTDKINNGFTFKTTGIHFTYDIFVII